MVTDSAMTTPVMNKEEIWKLLDSIPDPEIPVISIVELGVVRNVEVVSGSEVEITITPTYTGCPAMKLFEDDIVSTLKNAGWETVRLKTKFQPAWTTDWLSKEAREKLRAYGIAPPEGKSSDKKALLGISPVVHCPQCGSANTTMISQFGSTACKALYKCKDCLEPFDYFKCI